MMWRSIAIRAAMLSALWWVLTGGTAAAWSMGVVSVACATVASIVLLPPRAHGFAIRELPGFLAFFLFQSVKGGMQVAMMAIRPRLDLQPTMQEIRLRLPDESSRILLACTMSLLPGTMSAGLHGDKLLLHVLDRRLRIEQAVRNAEARIARLLGTRPS